MQDTTADRPTTFSVTAYRCRCGHEWVPSNLHSEERPRVCPKCKSPNWDRAYRFRRIGGGRVKVFRVEGHSERKEDV